MYRERLGELWHFLQLIDLLLTFSVDTHHFVWRLLMLPPYALDYGNDWFVLFFVLISLWYLSIRLCLNWLSWSIVLARSAKLRILSDLYILFFPTHHLFWTHDSFKSSYFLFQTSSPLLFNSLTMSFKSDVPYFSSSAAMKRRCDIPVERLRLKLEMRPSKRLVKDFPFITAIAIEQTRDSRRRSADKLIKDGWNHADQSYVFILFFVKCFFFLYLIIRRT